MLKINKTIALSLVGATSAFMVSCNGNMGANQPELPLGDNLENSSSYRGAAYKKDSLAIVAIYNATNGKDWHRNANWLRKGVSIDNWYGVNTDIIDGEERVVELRLGANKLGGVIPQEVGDLSALKVLELSENYKLSGTIPNEVYTLSDLRVWKMSFTDIHGELSSKIGNLTKIDTLDLWGAPWDLTVIGDDYAPKTAETLLSGKIPAEIGKLVNARYIVLGRNKFSGEIPQEIGNLKNVKYLDISRNELVGELPKTLGNLKNIVTFFTAGNKLTGELPSEIGNMTKLEQLYANENQLTGTIPASFGKLTNLTDLALNDNKMSGKLPDEIADMKSLALLYLENNKFSGEIPVRLAGEGQPRMIEVRLSNNNFTGSLPKIVPHDFITFYDNRNWGKVYTKFYVDGNRLTGEIPSDYYSSKGELQEGILPQQAGYELKKAK